jgi:glucosyl-dolichyl phosphate glucuronosyltransferase
MPSNSREAPSLDVIICTRNRSRLLSRCLGTLLKQRGIDRCIVTVVDNGSADDTPEVCRSFCERFRDLRYIFEPVCGISAARNRGLAECSAEFLAYLDDDAVVEPGWVEAMLSAFEVTGADVVGGPILPYWDDERPWWVSESLMPFFSMLYLGEDTYVPEAFPPFGGNMAFRTQVLRRAEGFDTELGVRATDGRRNTAYLGEDTQVIRNLLSTGSSVAYAGRAKVQHLTHGRMCSLRGLRERAEQVGRTAARLGCGRQGTRTYEDEWLWCAACAMSSLLRFRLRDAIAFYMFAVVSGAIVRESRSQPESILTRMGSLTRAAFRMRRGLLGLARRTIIGTPPCSSTSSDDHRYAAVRAN